MRKYKTYFTDELTLHEARIVNTEQLQHYIPQKHVLFNYITVSTLHKCDNRGNNKIKTSSADTQPIYILNTSKSEIRITQCYRLYDTVNLKICVSAHPCFE